MSLDTLYGELHLIASRYHWSEAEILRLTASKRRRYLRLIDSHAGAEEAELG